MAFQDNRLTVDTVGSFLPPARLFETREQYSRGMIDGVRLREVEEESVKAIVDRQIQAGLPFVTSGELMRRYWDKDFFMGLGGIERECIEAGHLFHNRETLTDLLHITGRIEYNPRHPFFDDFTFVSGYAGGRAAVRQTIPSPTELYMDMLEMSSGNVAGIYPYGDDPVADIAAAYRATIMRFYELGCRSLQLDDTACGRMCDDYFRMCLAQGGIDIYQLLDALVRIINLSVEGVPSDMEVSIYLSGGNVVIPEWDTAGEIDSPTPEVLSQLKVSKFYLPFDLHDLKSMNILQYVPAGAKVVLGLVGAHSPQMESVADIEDAVACAGRYIPLDRLSVSPTSGFKLSSYEMRGLGFEDQWNKIAELKAAVDRIG